DNAPRPQTHSNDTGRVESALLNGAADPETVAIAERVVSAYLDAGGDPWPWHVDPLRRQALQTVARGVSGDVLVEAARRVGAGAWGGVLYPYFAGAVRVVERERARRRRRCSRAYARRTRTLQSTCKNR